MKTLEKFSMGTGDRFGRQGEAQLSAMMKARAAGAEVAIVWNKSYREHSIIHTEPASVRLEADAAVKALGWTGGYHVDADHIGLKTVDIFMDSSDFFTLDVADFTGKPASGADIEAFVKKYSAYIGELKVPGIAAAIEVTESKLRTIGEKYLLAVQEAAAIYRKIEAAKGKDSFITEVSMDETDAPQTPDALFFILAMIADAGIPAQTIAPKFTGRFNKGVDYVGNVEGFNKEFEEDVLVVQHAIRTFGLPSSLKLSIHSGSDKFSIYPGIRAAIRKHNAGLHLKTAGTTWLEELVGLAEAGGEGLGIAKEVYANALGRFDELCVPYATVIDIDRSRLPSAAEVNSWDGPKYARTLRHDPGCPDFNANFRQLIHVGYKVASEMGERYTGALEKYRDLVGHHVTENIFERHIKKLFL